MNKIFNEYVIYCLNENEKLPFAVVSSNDECKTYTDYIPSKLKEYLIHIEDKRFNKHIGIDIKGIVRASLENVKAGKIVQGGSTITQQLARNILKDNEKSIMRKFRETIKAIHIESNYTKDEILNIYFNNVYFGKNLRGIRSASLYYFNKEVRLLSQAEQLYLLTILRGPNYYINNPIKAFSRYEFLSRKLFNDNLISKNRHKKNINTRIETKNNHLQIVRNQVIPYIVESTDDFKKTIFSTIDKKIQDFANQFVKESKYPLSIVAIKNKKVAAFASSYGTDYPFISKSNVGSTLKPFIYCYLKNKGVMPFERFDACHNELNWKVREASYQKDFLSLDEALLYSNNNAFINAANKHGMDELLQYLADIFNQEFINFYPASILGATKKGISLYELALSYSKFFQYNYLSKIKTDCLFILNRIFTEKLGFNIENAFLKTGTTNNNIERFAILGNPEITFAILRNENPINDESKEGGFINQISRIASSFFKPNTNYKWI